MAIVGIWGTIIAVFFGKGAAVNAVVVIDIPDVDFFGVADVFSDGVFRGGGNGGKEGFPVVATIGGEAKFSDVAEP